MLMQWNSQKPAPLKTKGLVLVSSGKIFGIKCQPVVKNNLYIWLPVIISIVIGQEKDFKSNPVFLAVPLIDPNEISDWESSRKSVAMFTLSY
jgi:hypothetical protein